MKSSKQSLQKRGFIEENDVLDFNHLSNSDLLNLLNSTHSYERTIAVRLLFQRKQYYDLEITKLLLVKLSNEKSLYTKLEICKLLEHGNLATAKLMTSYLGIIGNNQYTCLPENVSRKKSYPLPRDIIARSLARMSFEVITTLEDVLLSNNEPKISEAVDALGFMLFYNQDKLNISYYNLVLSTMQKYHYNDLIYWKCITCLSAFNSVKNIALLKRVLVSDKPKLIREEASRSLKILQQRKKSSSIINY